MTNYYDDLHKSPEYLCESQELSAVVGDGHLGLAGVQVGLSFPELLQRLSVHLSEDEELLDADAECFLDERVRDGGGHQQVVLHHPVEEDRGGGVGAALHVQLGVLVRLPVLLLLPDGVDHPGVVVGLHVGEVGRQ